MASLGGFVRPGSKSSSSLGFNFDVDRDADERPPVITYNSRARQSLSEQRAALPVYAQRENFLRLVRILAARPCSHYPRKKTARQGARSKQ